MCRRRTRSVSRARGGLPTIIAMSAIRGIPRTLLPLAWLAAGACMGTIDEQAGTAGSSDNPAVPGNAAGPGGAKGGLIDGTGAPGATSNARTCAAGSIAVTPRLVRLTRFQYENSVRDVTGLDVRPSRD